MEISYFKIYGFICSHWKVYHLQKPDKIAFNIKITIQWTIKFACENKYDRFKICKQNIQ